MWRGRERSADQDALGLKGEGNFKLEQEGTPRQSGFPRNTRIDGKESGVRMERGRNRLVSKKKERKNTKPLSCSTRETGHRGRRGGLLHSEEEKDKA